MLADSASPIAAVLGMLADCAQALSGSDVKQAHQSRNIPPIAERFRKKITRVKEFLRGEK
jgi:hypothetical protein